MAERLLSCYLLLITQCELGEKGLFVKYVICGFSGAGKSQLLKSLELEGRYPEYAFIDLDLHIASRDSKAGCVREIIDKKGMEYWRECEYLQTLSILSSHENCWLALGGGALEASFQGQRLADVLSQRKDCEVYWLDTPFELCWERIANDRQRPLVAKGRDFMRRLYESRLEQYRQFSKY